MLASHRAREISSGSSITVDRDNDKNPVVALREIADEMQSSDELRERLIESNQTQIEVNEKNYDRIHNVVVLDDIFDYTNGSLAD